MDDFAIKVDGVSKIFKLPHEKAGSVKGAVVNFWRRDRTYENQRALDNMSFEVKKGEFFGIVGRNGSGKSTLLKILAGIYTPSSGSVYINGNLTPFIELGVGFNLELTGRENVYLNGALLGFNRKQMDSMYKDIVEFAELKRFMDQKLKNYSSGMQVRLAFSIAIQAQSDILLIDEVLAVGDISFQQKCFDYFRELKRSSKTVIFISHDLNSVEEFCNRVAIVDRNKLVGIGVAREMVMLYKTVMAEVEVADQSSEPNNRPGTKECVISEVMLLNKQNKKVKAIKEREPFSIKVFFKGHIDTEVVLGLSINDKNDNSLIGPNTKEDKFVIKVKAEEEKHITAYFSENLLTAGDYSIAAGLFNYNVTTPFDYFENAAALKVLGEKRNGKINAQPKWSTY